jgi:putative membrane protein
MPSDGDSRTLHPVSIVIGVPLVQLVRTLIVPAAAVFAGGADLGSLLLLVIVAGGLTARILAWQRFRWSFDGRRVRVESGVLSRTLRSVGVDRIQQVELEQPFVQRLLGVATLRIETAGSDAGPEVELRVLRLAEATELRDALQPHLRRAGAMGTADAADHEGGDDGAERVEGAAASASVRGVQPATARTVLALPLRRVALSSVTGAQLLLAPALLVGSLQILGERTDDLVRAVLDRVLFALEQGAAPSAATWAVGVAAVVAVAVVTTLVVSVVRDGGFVVERIGDDLVMRRGLLGTRESTVPLRRVQVVRVLANPLRRLLGVAAVRIHSAGGSSGGERRVVIPLVSVEELEALLGELVDGFVTLPPLTAHPPAARRRALLRRLRGLLVWWIPGTLGWIVLGALHARGADVRLPAAVTWSFTLSDDVRVVPLVIVVVGVVLAWLLAIAEHRALAHGHDRHVLAARHGTLARTLSVAPLERLQAVSLLQSVLQARRDLATVVAHVAGPGGDVVVLDAATTTAQHLREVLARAASGGPMDAVGGAAAGTAEDAGEDAGTVSSRA